MTVEFDERYFPDITIFQVLHESDLDFPVPVDDEDFLEEEFDAIASNWVAPDACGDLVEDANSLNNGEVDLDGLEPYCISTSRV
jgi:hypothetical protein